MLFDEDNIKKAMSLLDSYCEKCRYHGELGCRRAGGVCEVDEAWEFLSVSNLENIEGWEGEKIHEIVPIHSEGI